MTTAVHPDLDEVRDAVAGVPDPELPPVTLGMLGMIHDVRVEDDGHVVVELMPTFSGCPATEMMGRDVESDLAEVEGVERVTVHWRYDPPWSSANITEEGHERLKEFGIAPPTGGGPVSDVTPEGRTSLPLMIGAPTAADQPVACPYCGSEATERESPFGPTPCRDIHFCTSCNHPFERFKDL